MAEPCDNAKVLAATLLWNNEEFAKEMIDAASQYQFAKSLMWDKATKNMENEIDLFVRSTIDARILQWEAWLEAYVSLVKRAKNRWGTIASWAELIEMVKNISLKDIDQYAWLLFKEGEWADRAAEVIEDLKNSICQYTARKMNLSMKYETKLKKMQQSAKGKRDKVEKEFKEMEKAQKELKSLVGKMKDWKPITDEEARRMTELVNKLTPIDETWTSMISDAKNGKINVDFYKSYILWRVFLSEDPDVIPDLIKFISLPKGSYSNLTVEMINSLTYNQLVTAVYKNTLQLANNKELRDALKNRIISLMTSSEDGRMSPTAVAYADSLVNTLYFCDAWESFSTVLKYNKVWEAVRKILTDDRWFSLLKWQSNKRIFNALKSLLEDKDLVKNLWSSKKEKTVDFLWVQINWTTLLNMIYAGTWDENLRKAITLHWNIADDIIIDYAKVKMFWWKSKTAEDNLRAVLQKANKEYSANEISTIAYKATSSIPVNPTNPSKIVFIDFREAENTLPDAYNARSRFYDALADINTLTVSSEQVSVFSPDKLDTIWDDVEYIIIPNAKYMSDSRVTELKNRIAKKNKEVLVVYPRWKESWNYFVDRWDWLLKYKTSSTAWFNELSDRMAVESLNQAEVPSINNLPQTTAQEKLNELNNAWINFFRHYLWMWDTATNEQVITALSDLTWIPLNWNSMSPADWELANRVAFLNYTVSWNYKTSYLTSEGYDNLVKEYSLYKADDVVEFLKARGYSYDYKTIEANLDSIKEALINMHTSDNVADYIQYKGILIWLANRWEANNITLTEIRRILEGWNENEELAKLLYGNRANWEYTVTELKSTDSFLSDILNAYVDWFSRKITEAWYTLPMYRPDWAILNYLKWKPITNDYFATSFAVKNWMTLDEPSFKQLFDDMMPSEVSVSSSISPETLRAARKWKWENLTKVIDEIPEEERMLPREYNSYWAALWGRVLSPKASENARKLAAAVMRERTRASRISREEWMTILKKYFTDEEIEMLNPEFSDEFFKWNPRAEWAFVKWRRSLHFIENPLKWTVEHETVHAYIDMFLTKKERKELFDYVKKNHLNEVKKFADTHWYTKYVSNWKTYNYTLDQQVEEWIAESFIEYVKKYEWAKKTPQWVSKLWPTMETLYEKIWLAVKNFFNRANVNKLNSFYNDIVEKRRPQWWVIQRWWQGEVKWREWRWIKYPTSDELDEWLWKKSFSDRLKDTFWETDDIKRWIFITKDWSLIKWTSEWWARDYPIQYPNWNVWIQLEHYWAISPILFNEWNRIWILGSEDYYAQNILRYIQRKEWLIRTRFFENEWRIYITIDTPPEISWAQRRVIQEYVDYLNDELEYSWKTWEISIDWIYWENWRWEWYRLDTDEWRISLNNVDFSKLDNWKAVYDNDEIKNTNERIKSFRWETDDSNYVSINNPYTDKEWWKNHTVWRQTDLTDNNGNVLSEWQKSFWFMDEWQRNLVLWKDTKWDNDWKVITFYHWTPYKFNKFDLSNFRRWSWDSEVPWFYFSTQKDTKVLMNPKQANNLFEVYIKSDNPIDWAASVNEYFADDDVLMKFIKDFHEAKWESFDEERWSYKIYEWSNWRDWKWISMHSFMSKIVDYPEIFWDDIWEFLDYFVRTTWIDWMRDTDEIFISFRPDYIKSVTNRNPGNSDYIAFRQTDITDNVDNNGNLLSEWQVEYFRDSAVRDSEWNLEEVYHWTRDNIKVPKIWKNKNSAYWPWMYFTTKRESAERFAEWIKWVTSFFKSPKLLTSYLNITNPIEAWKYNWNEWWTNALKDLWYNVKWKYLANKNTDDYDKYITFWIMNSKKDKEEFIEDIKKVTWYDWVKIDQKWIETYWIAFSPDQVKRTDNLTPTDNPDIRYRFIERDELAEDITPDNISDKITEYLKEDFKEHNILWVFWLKEGDDLFDWAKIGEDEIIKRFKSLTPSRQFEVINKMAVIDSFLQADLNSRSKTIYDPLYEYSYIHKLISDYKALGEHIDTEENEKLWVAVDSLKWSSIYDIANKDIPIEMSFVTDDSWKIEKAALWHWQTTAFLDIDDIWTEWEKINKSDYTFWHIHPMPIFFSPADIDAFEETLNEAWKESFWYWWLVLRWWMALKFKNTEESIKELRKLQAGWIADVIDGLVDLSIKQWIPIEQQEWWAFTEYVYKYIAWVEYSWVKDIQKKLYKDLRRYYAYKLWIYSNWRINWRNTAEWSAWLTETDIIQQILDNYANAVESHIKDWTMTVKLAQDLKQQASYALNVAWEDLILKKYWDLLNASDRNWILWLWFNLNLATNEEELKLLREKNAATMDKFRQRWAEVAGKVNKNYNSIDEAGKELMENWKIYTEREWQQVVIDIKDELYNSIKNIPDWAWEFTNLRTLDRNYVNWLTNKQAYTMLKIIALVKQNIAKGNFYTSLMYKLNPQLRRTPNGLNFFENFKAVQIADDGNWNKLYVPKILVPNNTLWFVEPWKQLDNTIDLDIKSSILKDIYNDFISKWKVMKQEDLEKIVDDAVKWSVWEPYKQYYLNAYAPYVNLMWIHNDTYNYLTKILSEETEEIRNLLKDIATWDWSDWDLQWQNLLNMKVTLDDWSTVTVWDMVSWNAKRWEQRLFWEMWNKEAFWELDEAWAKEQLKWAYSWYNDVNNITNNEAKIITWLLWNARKLLQRDTNTNQFVEFDYTVGWQNDTVKSLLLWNVFSGMIPWADASKVKKRVNSARRWGRLLLWWNNVWAFNSGNWKKIQQLYEIYYAKDLQELKKTQAPDDALHQTALEMAKYFKTIENTLGSKDWIKWVALNDLSVNKAFWNIWTIVKDIDWAWNVFSLMNKIWNNQVLWFFKFTKKWSPAYNETLKRWWTWTKKARYLFSPVAQNYIEYSNANKEDMKNEFNSIFWTTFTTDEANMAIQALWWYKMIGNSKAEEWINNINWFISNTMTLTRMLMTYPLQLLTIYPQLFAYNVKANGIKEALWVENVADARRIRQKYWILEWTYVDIPFWNWFDSIFSRDSDEIENLWLNIDDWVMWLYWKTTDYVVSNYTTPQLLALWDSVRDNANNIVDAAMAQTFKSLAFVKALQNNDFITFMNPHLFEEFMNNPEVSKEIKDKLLDRVNNYSNRLLQDMLGIWFTWLDRVYTSWAVWDILSGLLSAINFKWAWWTNMFRQTFEKAFTIYKIAKRDWWSIDRTVKDIMAIPEMTTLLSCMFADAVWMWRLWKFNDNWKVPDSDAEFTTAYALDFISWIADNIDLVSQQWQWLISFWWTRPFLKWAQVWYRWAQWEWKTAAERIWDFAVYWLWGFLQSFATNLWRNWKPAAFVTEALLVLEQQWYDAFINYLQNSWYMISWWTIRYMIEEWENAYWSNTPLNIETKWIPSLLAWNQYEDSDTAFSFKVRELESWEYLKSLYKSDRDWWYWLSQWVTLLVNSSQFLKTLRNIGYGVWTRFDAWANDWFLTWSKRNFWIYDMTTIEDDLKASPTFVELQETGKARPNTAEQAKDLVETFTQPTYLWWYKAYQWIQNFIKSGHLNGKEEWYYYDKDLEEFYQRIEETKPWTLEETMKLFNSYFLWDPDWEEARKFLYSWAWQWLDAFKNDPEYNKYKATFARWTLNNLYYWKLANLALVETAKRKAMWFPDNLAKVSVTDLKNNNIAIEWFNTKFADTYYDTMYDADRALVQNKIYNWVAEELDDWTVKKYFSKQKKKDWEGNETDEEEYVLDSNLKAQLRQEVEFEWFLADWDWENAIASAAILTRQLAYWDESWLIQAALTKRYVDRIQDSDLPEELKIAAIAKLMDNNEEAFKYNSDFAEKYPEIWAQWKSYLNDILHWINGSVITDLNNMAIMTDALNEALEDALSSSGKKSKGSNLLGWWGWWVWTWLKLTSKLAKLSSDINKSPGTAKAIEPATMKIIPIPIKWIFPESKYNKPTFTVRTYTTKGYEPKTKTLWPITPPKKNKAVKAKSTRKMTQKEENELDLI